MHRNALLAMAENLHADIRPWKDLNIHSLKRTPIKELFSTVFSANDVSPQGKASEPLCFPMRPHSRCRLVPEATGFAKERSSLSGFERCRAALPRLSPAMKIQVAGRHPKTSRRNSAKSWSTAIPLLANYLLRAKDLQAGAPLETD